MAVPQVADTGARLSYEMDSTAAPTTSHHLCGRGFTRSLRVVESHSDPIRCREPFRAHDTNYRPLNVLHECAILLLSDWLGSEDRSLATSWTEVSSYPVLCRDRLHLGLAAAAAFNDIRRARGGRVRSGHGGTLLSSSNCFAPLGPRTLFDSKENSATNSTGSGLTQVKSRRSEAAGEGTPDV